MGGPPERSRRAKGERPSQAEASFGCRPLSLCGRRASQRRVRVVLLSESCARLLLARCSPVARAARGRRPDQSSAAQIATQTKGLALHSPNSPKSPKGPKRARKARKKVSTFPSGRGRVWIEKIGRSLHSSVLSASCLKFAGSAVCSLAQFFVHFFKFVQLEVRWPRVGLSAGPKSSGRTASAQPESVCGERPRALAA